MERSNELSLNRQRQTRQRNEYSENLIDSVTRQNVGDRLDYLNELQSSGRIDNTKDSRAVKEEIERLEEYQQLSSLNKPRRKTGKEGARV